MHRISISESRELASKPCVEASMSSQI
jgi:hypothetical protein